MEGYPGVVVHGPYTMQQLLNFVVDMNPTETLRSFEMKALQPLYVDQPIRLCGKPSEGGRGCEVWAVSPNGVSQVQLLSSRLSSLSPRLKKLLATRPLPKRPALLSSECRETERRRRSRMQSFVPTPATNTSSRWTPLRRHQEAS